jgi:hypothetical protein
MTQVDAEFDAKMTALNDFCLEHSTMNVSDFEYFMERLLDDWIRRIREGTAKNTPNFRKWAEIVSRWSPLYWYAEESINCATTAGSRLENHIRDLYPED